MPFLPVAERELRAAARRPGTHRVRIVAALVAALAFGWKLLDLSDRQIAASEQGAELFFLLAALAFVYSLIIGAHVSADSLSREKREGTLGLLFLTDLKGYDVVLGKLAAVSINVIYGLIAILPMLAAALLMGGISLAKVALTALALLSTLLLSLSAGMLVSSYERNERRAIFFTIVLLLAIIVGPVLIAGFSRHTLFGLLSPAAMVWVLFADITTTIPGEFFVSVISTWGISIVFLIIASNRLPNSWQEAPARTSSSPAGAISNPEPTAPKQKAFRLHLLDRNPFVWLAIQKREKIFHVWGFIGAMGLIWLLGGMQGGPHRRLLLDVALVIPWILFVNTFLKIWVAYETTNRLVNDRAAGALELLLTTPLNERAIIRGQWLALWVQFGKPFSVLLLVECLILLNGKFGEARLYLAALLVFVADIIALGWVGMWLGLTAKGLNRAAIRTVGLVMTLPWLLFLALKLGLEVRAIDRVRFPMAITLWTLVALTVNAVLVFAWARPRLMSRFRTMAAHPFERAP